MPEIPFRSAKQLAALLRRRKLGCLELLDLYLARVARHNPRINAVVVTSVESARKRARAADAALRKGQVWGPCMACP
jgi:amidase